MKINKMNLQLFGHVDYGTSDFFTQAFSEMYTEGDNVNNTDTEVPSEPLGATESNPSNQVDEIPDEDIQSTPDVEETPSDDTANQEVSHLTREEMLEAIKATQQEPVLDEETQQALELMSYLKENPHLIQAMREINPDAHQTLNNYVPDEMTKKIQQFEEFMIEQQYQAVVKDMQTKYPDYDADKVLEFAEKHEINDLEVAYKALRADDKPSIDVETERAKIREEIRAEILKELKETETNTSSIVGTGGTVPQVQNSDVLSHQEKKVAMAMGMSPTEYAKWRDGK
ncbi:hypothetical protein [Romboutsia sp.]|uniref:hypothetical protein n=1 Tax=Romboutsia sp. TaxID=1965302 RepID=UPI002B528EFD|nr:hypothetical protein [Romboutsia sp.]HSQ90151.1 hypothetical protein [Romboutsia sp.]